EGSKPSNGNGDTPAEPEKPRRALPAPFNSPPFPSGEYQGYPLVGVPPDDATYPLMKAIYGGPWGEEIKDSRVKVYGWINASGNWSTSKNSNMPDSYWIVPNRFELDQVIVRAERQVDSVQQDHIDIGFRSTLLYGIDYRYMTAGGWFSNQLLEHNFLYGADPTEQYIDVYLPGIAQGMIVRVGRWIACPDIETQFAPDNFLGTHSLLFTFDTYTQTGVMATVMLDKQWTVQAAIHAGTDMAPWYPGATPTGMFGIRWVACDNNDSVYTVLNSINDARFRYFVREGKLEGHDNFNYVVSTWQHRFNKEVQTRTEGYFMWQLDAVTGGTPSFGPPRSFGSGGGFGTFIPGTSLTYGLVNYTEVQLSKKDYFSFRNEWWRDEQGERSGFRTNYSSHTIGLAHNFNEVLQVRPEIGWYHSYDVPAFDLGTRRNMVLYGFDMTLRF
ncbi:MAG TPA: outer membrane beta-barrel protein, partial [Gemmataceae bacterium]|nr:outer membrane beta-barrel protein [Gemmataceae bacterium]